MYKYLETYYIILDTNLLDKVKVTVAHEYYGVPLDGRSHIVMQFSSSFLLQASPTPPGSTI